jgi:hypothetical protein
MHVVNIVETVTTLLNAGLIVVLLHAGWGLTGMALSTAGTMALAGVVLIPLAYRFVDGLSLSPRLFNFRQVSPLLSFSICVFVANVATLMMLRMDPVVIKFFLSLSSVAVYAVAAKIAEYTLLLNKQFSNALMPLISRSRGAADLEKIRAVLTDGTRYLLAIAMPLSVLLFLYADDRGGFRRKRSACSPADYRVAAVRCATECGQRHGDDGPASNRSNGDGGLCSPQRRSLNRIHLSQSHSSHLRDSKASRWRR